LRIFSAARDLCRGLAFDDRQRIDLRVAAEHGKLLHRGRAAHVERSHQRFLAEAIGETAGELGRRGGFARALQAHHHDRDRRRGVEIDRLRFVEGRDQLVMHDLDDELARRDRLDEFGTDRLCLDLLGEGARHIERDVGFEQRPANFAQRVLDIGLAQRATPRQAVENAVQAIGQ
jgi:hypothetical protein